MRPVSDTAFIVTSPLPVTAGLGVDDLAVAVVADAIARRTAAATGTEASVHLPALLGDRAAVLALERAGRPVSDLAAFEVARAAQVDEQLAALNVSSRVSDEGMRARVGDAATVAFVRLYDQGLVDEIEIVVATCPSCATVVDGADAEPGTVEADVLDIAVAWGDGRHEQELLVPVVAPELLAGATAVAVPVDHPAAGGTVMLPFGRGRVPVVAETGRVEPSVVVPAHSRDGHDLALLHGLDAPAVLGPDGVVVAGGPLAGLSRYAARQAARDLVEAEGAVLAVMPGEEEVERCRHCGSTTVPVLGRHWALRGGRLEVAAADAVRDGLVTFVPADAREAFLAIAIAVADWPGRRSSASAARPSSASAVWCLDRTVAGGVPLPVATCVDCGRVSVDATPSSTCGTCLGELRASDRTFDPRFVAAFWPLAIAGWPRPARAAPPAIAVVTPAATTTWLLPALALARHFTGELPIGSVVVHPPNGWPEGTALTPDVEGEDIDERAFRLALLAGDLDVDAHGALDALEHARGDDPDVADAVEAAAAELDEGGSGPAQATALLLAALGTGVRAADIDRARQVAAPFLGEG